MKIGAPGFFYLAIFAGAGTQASADEERPAPAIPPAILDATDSWKIAEGLCLSVLSILPTANGGTASYSFDCGSAPSTISNAKEFFSVTEVGDTGEFLLTTKYKMSVASGYYRIDSLAHFSQTGKCTAEVEIADDFGPKKHKATKQNSPDRD
jgi:hypothetical protein